MATSSDSSALSVGATVMCNYSATQFEVVTIVSISQPTPLISQPTRGSGTALIKHSTRGCTATVPLALLQPITDTRAKRSRGSTPTPTSSSSSDSQPAAKKAATKKAAAAPSKAAAAPKKPAPKTPKTTAKRAITPTPSAVPSTVIDLTSTTSSSFSSVVDLTAASPSPAPSPVPSKKLALSPAPSNYLRDLQNSRSPHTVSLSSSLTSPNDQTFRNVLRFKSLPSAVTTALINDCIYSSPTAAVYACNRRVLFDEMRLVGTSVFELEVGKTITPSKAKRVVEKVLGVGGEKKAPLMRPETGFAPCPPGPSKVPLNEALDRFEALHPATKNEKGGVNSREHLEKCVKAAWEGFLRGLPETKQVCYDRSSGHFNTSKVDPSAIDLLHLASLLENDTVIDRNADSVNRYNVSVGALDVLYAIQDLATCTKATFNVPLVGGVARLAPTQPTAAGGKVKFEVFVDVYIHRMLFEILTSENLQTLFGSLHPTSYKTIKPLHVMAVPTKPMFEASPATKLTMPDYASHLGFEPDDEDDDVEEISCFSTRGVMKLIENFGSDVSKYESEYRQLLYPAAPVQSGTSGLKLKLMEHQVHGFCWMMQMESIPNYGVNSLFWEERQFNDGGAYFFSPNLGQIRLNPPPKMLGGVLADEMGLGKTIMTVATIVASLGADKAAVALEKKSKNPNLTHATIIIVPPSLLFQWMSEIEKCASNLKAFALDHRKFQAGRHAFGKEVLFDKNEYQKLKGELMSADVIVTTYDAVSCTAGATISARTDRVCDLLASIRYGRVCLDEMQEIRSSTTDVAKRCDGLRCTKRWMISGTPLFDGLDDLKGELQFLRVEPFCAGLEDGFWKFLIKSHFEVKSNKGIEVIKTLSNLILRRSKDMSMAGSNHQTPIMGLPLKHVKYVPVLMEPSERAFYSYMEWVFGDTLKTVVATASGESDQTTASRKSSQQNVRSCVRLLMEFARSPLLLSGGYGIRNENLGTLNKIVRAWLSKNQGSKGGAAVAIGVSSRKIMSCHDALEYISHAEFTRAAGDNNDAVGGGMNQGVGANSRARAGIRPEAQLRTAKLAIMDLDIKVKQDIRARAKIRWHWALEQITCGQLKDEKLTSGVAKKIKLIWKLRALRREETAILESLNTKNRTAEIAQRPAVSNAGKSCVIPLEYEYEDLYDGEYQSESDHEAEMDDSSDSDSDSEGNGRKKKRTPKKKKKKELTRMQDEVEFDPSPKFKGGRSGFVFTTRKIDNELVTGYFDGPELLPERSSLEKKQHESMWAKFAHGKTHIADRFGDELGVTNKETNSILGYHAAEKKAAELAYSKFVTRLQDEYSLQPSAIFGHDFFNIPRSNGWKWNADWMGTLTQDTLKRLLGEDDSEDEVVIDNDESEEEADDDDDDYDDDDMVVEVAQKKKTARRTSVQSTPEITQLKKEAKVAHQLMELVHLRESWLSAKASIDPLCRIALREELNVDASAVPDHAFDRQLESFRGWRATNKVFFFFYFKYRSSWHWLRPCTFLLLGCPGTVTSEELATTLFEASKKTPYIQAKLDKSADGVKEGSLKLAQAESALNGLTDTIGHDSDDWSKEVEKQHKKLSRKVTEAAKKLLKSEDVTAKINSELATAQSYEDTITWPRVVLLDKKDGTDDKTGYFIFQNVAQFSHVQTMLSKMLKFTTDQMELMSNHGVRVATAKVPEIVELKEKETKGEEDKLQIFHDSGNCHLDELEEAKFLAKLCGDGMRIKFSLDGVPNSMRPAPMDDGNIYVQTQLTDPQWGSKGVWRLFSARSGPGTSEALLNNFYTNSGLTGLGGKIATNKQRIAEEEVKRGQMMKAVKNSKSGRVQDMTTFQTLEALKRGDEGGMCSVCCDAVGSTGIDDGEEGEPSIAMTQCGHFYCRECIDKTMDSGHNNCPECRAEITKRTTCLIKVDDEQGREMRREKLAEEKEEALAAVKSIYALFDGEGDNRFAWQPHAVEQLYKSADEPSGVAKDRIEKFAAIDPIAAAYLRDAVQLELPVLDKNAVEKRRGAEVPGSKIAALLRDLPKGDEHSVVFSQSEGMCAHIEYVLNSKKIGCRLLVKSNAKNDGAASAAANAVRDWKEGKNRDGTLEYPVLIVQAGAAASGLTLVEASKMFIMEPMARQNEEEQAQARCHRFGQKKEVHVTTYFAPCSVESRVLGLRADVVHLENETRRQAQRRLDDSELIDLVDSDEESGGEEGEGGRRRGGGADSDGDDDSFMDMEAEGAEEEEVGDNEKAKAEARRSLYLCGVVNTL